MNLVSKKVISRKRLVALAAANGDVVSLCNLRVALDEVYISTGPPAQRPVVMTNRMHFLKKEYSDMTLVVQGESIPAHKIIVCSRSPVFKAMFNIPMQEATTSNVVVGDEFTVDTVEAMLQYLYTNSIPEDDLDVLAFDLLAIGSYYQINTLTQFVADYFLVEPLSVVNVAAILIAAKQYSLKPLLKRTLRYIMANSTTLVSTKGFLRPFTDLQICRMVMKALGGVLDTSLEDDDEQAETS